MPPCRTKIKHPFVSAYLCSRRVNLSRSKAPPSGSCCNGWTPAELSCWWQVGPTACPHFSSPVVNPNCGTWLPNRLLGSGQEEAQPIFPICFCLFSVKEYKPEACSWQGDSKGLGVPQKKELCLDPPEARSFQGLHHVASGPTQNGGSMKPRPVHRKGTQGEVWLSPRRQNFDFIPSKLDPPHMRQLVVTYGGDFGA